MTLAADTSQAVARLVHATPISVPLVSVAANSLIALFCLSDADVSTSTESLSIGTTGGLTWTRNVQANGSPGAVAAVFTAPFAAGGSITPTVIDSSGMTDSASETGVIPVIFTDTNGGIPGVGATATGNGSTTLTTTVASSWVWGCGLGQGIDDANQTRIFHTTGSSFDGGDDINVAKENATTPTLGTVVNMSLGSQHTASIEITPGSGGTNATVTPSVVAATAGVGTVTVQAGAQPTPSTVVATAGVGTVAAQGGAKVVPATVAAIAGVGTPTIQAGSNANVTPATVVATASIGSALAQAGVGILPATVVGVVGVGAAQAQGGSKVTPATVVGVAGVGAPAVQGGATILPATVVATAFVPAPSLGGSTTVQPATVAAVAGVGTVAMRTGSTVSPLTVSTIAAIPTPNVGPVGPATNTGAGFLIALGSGGFR